MVIFMGSGPIFVLLLAASKNFTGEQPSGDTAKYRTQEESDSAEVHSDGTISIMNSRRIFELASTLS